MADVSGRQPGDAGYDPTLDWEYALGGDVQPTYTAPVFGSAAPAPTGSNDSGISYPSVIIHPERPAAAFVHIGGGNYRTPTGETQPYITVWQYIQTAQVQSATDLNLVLNAAPNGVWIVPAGNPAISVASQHSWSFQLNRRSDGSYEIQATHYLLYAGIAGVVLVLGKMIFGGRR